jgi:uncharacterized membrane protein YgcG
MLLRAGHRHQDLVIGSRERRVSQLTDDEAGRLIHLRNELVNMVAEWKKHGWGQGLAARFQAMSKLLDNEPVPSPGFQNLANRKSALTEQECQTMINGSLLALAHAQRDRRLVIPTQAIFEAHAALGTLAIAISDDDSHVTITGMRKQ